MTNKKNNLLVERVKDLLNSAFHGGAWHGPSILELVKGITAKEAGYKAGNIHNIAELIYHITSWRIFVLKRLQGDSSYNIEDDKANWGNLGKVDQLELETLLMEMTLSHDELIKELDTKNDTFLDTIVPGSEYTYYTLIHGIIHHDLYHAGQIAIIKKLAVKAIKVKDEEFEGSRFFEDEFEDDIL